MSSWDDTKFSNENRVRLNELIKMADFRKNKKFKTYRYFKTLQKMALVYLPIYKDGKPLISQTTNKAVNIPFQLTYFDPVTESFDETKECPFVKASETIRKHIKDEKLAKTFAPQTVVIAQAIDRKLQENPDDKGKPSKKERQTGFKDSLDSDSFTPVECHTINYSIGQALESYKETNTVIIKDKKGNKNKVEKSLADHKYGKDVMIKYDDSAQGTGKYKVQAGDRTPITEEEEALLCWDVASAIKETTMSTKEAKIEAERIVKEFMKSVKKKSSDEDDDTDDEDLPDDIEADDEDEKPAKKKGSKDKDKKTSKKKTDDDDDDSDDNDPPFDLDEDEDSDDDDDEEEKKPTKKKVDKKKATKKPVKKTSKKDDDEEDSDDDDEDSDDELDLDDDD